MVRKSFLSMLLLLNIGGLLRAMETIKLPSAEKLNKYLCKNGFNHFVEKTNIDKDLGEKELYPLGVAVAVETHLYDYAEYVKNPMTSVMMQMRKQQLIECILQDSPKGTTEALIQQLKEGGAL